MRLPDLSFFDWMVIVGLLVIVVAVDRAAEKIVKAVSEMSEHILTELHTPEHVRIQEYEEQQAELESYIKSHAGSPEQQATVQSIMKKAAKKREMIESCMKNHAGSPMDLQPEKPKPEDSESKKEES